MSSKELSSKFMKKFGKEKIDAELPFSYIVFKQMDRILQAQTEGSASFLAGVEALEGALIFYIKNDEEYKKTEKEIEEAYEKRFIEITKGKKNIDDPSDQYSLSVAAYEKAKLKFKALMNLVGNQGMLPGKRTNFIDKGDDLPDDIDEIEDEDIISD